MNAHSPAPWRIVRGGDYTNDPGDASIASIEAADGTTVLYTDGFYFKPQESNARLIAAAPELLAVVRKFEADVMLMPEVREQARAAIRTATGDQS